MKVTSSLSIRKPCFNTEPALSNNPDEVLALSIKFINTRVLLPGKEPAVRCLWERTSDTGSSDPADKGKRRSDSNRSVVTSVTGGRQTKPHKEISSKIFPKSQPFLHRHTISPFLVLGSPFLLFERVFLEKMTPWTPQPAGLQEILQTIHESTDMNTAVQRTITQVRF
jgi:hypothetical protein